MGVAARGKKGCPARIARAVPASNAPRRPLPGSHTGLTPWPLLGIHELSPYPSSGSAADYVNANPFCLLSQAQEVLQGVFPTVRPLTSLSPTRLASGITTDGRTLPSTESTGTRTHHRTARPDVAHPPRSKYHRNITITFPHNNLHSTQGVPRAVEDRRSTRRFLHHSPQVMQRDYMRRYDEDLNTSLIFVGFCPRLQLRHLSHHGL